MNTTRQRTSQEITQKDHQTTAARSDCRCQSSNKNQEISALILKVFTPASDTLNLIKVKVPHTDGTDVRIMISFPEWIFLYVFTSIFWHLTWLHCVWDALLIHNLPSVKSVLERCFTSHGVLSCYVSPGQPEEWNWTHKYKHTLAIKIR